MTNKKTNEVLQDSEKLMHNMHTINRKMEVKLSILLTELRCKLLTKEYIDKVEKEYDDYLIDVWAVHDALNPMFSELRELVDKEV